MAILFATSSTITFMISERSRSCSCFDICAEVKIEILWKWWVKISSEASYLCANTIFLAASDKNFTAEWKNSVNEILENLSSTASLQWVPNLAGRWSNWKILFENVNLVDEWLIWKFICLSDRTREQVESVIKFKSKQLNIRYKMLGVVCGWESWARDVAWFGERGVELCGSVSKLRNNCVKWADGEWLKV